MKAFIEEDEDSGEQIMHFPNPENKELWKLAFSCKCKNSALMTVGIFPKTESDYQDDTTSQDSTPQTQTLPNCSTDKAYTYTLTASAQAVWTLTEGSLPKGLTLSADGTISGTPAEAGTFTFTAQAKTPNSTEIRQCTITSAFSLERAPKITTTSLTSGIANSPYGFQFEASGTSTAQSTLTWSADTLPDGLTLSTTGCLSGTPTTAGNYSFTVQASNSVNYDSKTFSLAISPEQQNAKPSILTQELRPAGLGVNYTSQLSATGTQPITWTAKLRTSNGLSMSNSGLITGSPTRKGKNIFDVTASNDYGIDKTKYILMVYEMPEIMTETLKEATVGKKYSVSLKKSGTAPLTWELEGTLPKGITFNAKTGKFSGTPEKNTSHTIRITLKNSVGEVSKTYTLTPTAITPKIKSTTLRKGTIGQSYKSAVTVTGTDPMTITLSGDLPSGLAFNADKGTITGTPTDYCTDNPITITASNMGGTASKTFSLTIKPIAPKIKSKSLPEGTISKDYSAQLEATGTAPITWTSSGLPAGLSIDNGRIYGTPSEAGTFKPTIKASNAAKTVSKKLKLVINSGPSFTGDSTLPEATADKSYSYTFSLAGTSPIKLSISGGSLPTGISLSGGKLKGKPKTAGTYTFTVNAANKSGTASQQFTLTVNALVPKISGTLKNGTQGVSYSAALKVKGTTPITWSIDGTLPKGITFSDGKFSGTPTEAFDGTITVTASNSGGTDSKSFTLTIKAANNTNSNTMTRNTTFSEPDEDYWEFGSEGDEDEGWITSADYVVVSELDEVSVDVSGMYDFDVVLDEAVETGAKLIWLADSETPSEDDGIAEFYDEDGEEIDSVPESHNITVSAWLNEKTNYSPKIAVTIH